MCELSCACILFDMDGVLVDSRAVVTRVWRQWSAVRGFEADAVIRAAQGRRTVDTLRSLGADLDIPAELRWLDDAELADRDGILPIAGAPQLVAGLPGGCWAVVTSAGRELAQRRLARAGLPIPACLVTADDVQNGKPSPEGYLAAARNLGVHPKDCVVLEDAPAGVQAAHAAGMRVIGLATTHSTGDLPGTETVLADLLAISVRERGDGLVLRCGG